MSTSDEARAARARAAASSIPSKLTPEQEEERAALRKASEAHAAAAREMGPLGMYLRFVAHLLRRPYDEDRFQAMYALLRGRFGISIEEPPNLALWEMVDVELQQAAPRAARIAQASSSRAKQIDVFRRKVWPKLKPIYGSKGWREQARDLCRKNGLAMEDRALDALLRDARKAGFVPPLRVSAK